MRRRAVRVFTGIVMAAFAALPAAAALADTLASGETKFDTVSGSSGRTYDFSGTAGFTGTSGNFTAGQLTLSLTPLTAGSGLTFIVTRSGKTGTSTFDVNPGALDHFAISGIAGTQTVTLIIRAIALGQVEQSNARWLFFKELAVGALNGIQSSVAHGAPLSRWITTLDPSPTSTVASRARTCSMTGVSPVPRLVK